VSHHKYRTCVCGSRLRRNVDKPKTWIHDLSGQKKCSPEFENGLSVATPQKVIIDDDVNLLLQGSTVWYRERDWWPDLVGNRRDLWSCKKQGSDSATLDALLDQGEVYILRKDDKPI
jgi:hypothetical protein